MLLLFPVAGMMGWKKKSSQRTTFSPEYTLHYHLIGINCRYSHSCPALFYVRNELLKNMPQARTTLSQLTINDPYYETLLAISGSSADALFFSAYVWNHDYISRLIKDLATIQPERPIILGGPQASAMTDLPENATLVIGEIEGVDRLFYRDLKKGKLEIQYSAAPGHPFQSPYLDEDLAGELRHRQVYYESSRGCPFRCSYCLSSVSKGVQHNSVEQVRRELHAILAHQPKIIKFVDRTFNDNPERALAIWHCLAEHSGPTRFHFEIAPDRFTEEMFALLEKIAIGRFQFEIGIQSTNVKTLAAINRSMDIGTAAANIRRLAGFDTIHLHVDLILGLPYETGESFRDSFNRVFTLQAHHIQMGLLKVLPGTPLWSNQQEFGLVYCARPPYQIMATRWLSHPELAGFYAFGECVEAFYNNRYFHSLWRYLSSGGEEPFSFFESLLAVSRRSHFAGLAPTQELLTRILHEMAGEREDKEIMRELLQYDWLRCGHRYLPDVFAADPLPELRNFLWKNLPLNMEGLYTPRSRSAFFKRAVFLRMTGSTLQQLGKGTGGRNAVVCFLPEQTGGVIRHCRTVLVEPA
ncbi:MAG: DUF4080 domain-containing protein [Desulfobulbaceae bacterium]|nr:DUF4080 domain-containing protein [Desulfobulbaceae bacterium]